MKRILLLVSLACSSYLYGQIRTDVGVNLTPLLLNSLDVQAEWQLAETFSLVANTGLRYQTQEPDQMPTIGVLREYMQPRNFGSYLAVSGRFFDREVNEYQYPFIQFGVVGSYYRESVLRDPNRGFTSRTTVQGLRLGITSTIGFVIRLTERANLDLALQMGYTQPREDLLVYYTPGLGYTTYGIDAVSIKGAHITPMLTFKYNILQSKRQRIHNME